MDTAIATPSSAPAAAGRRLTQGALFEQATIDGTQAVPTTWRYAIFSSQRTGSNYLCQRLCNVQGQLGMPAEYLNERAFRGLGQQLLPQAGDKLQLGAWLRAVEGVRTTVDGCFGVKVQPNQLLPMFQRKIPAVQRYLAQYDRLVLMTRRDKLGQAVSGAIAMATNKWFSHDGRDPSFTDAQVQALLPVIARNLVRYIDEEHLILQVGRATGRPTLHVEFEDIVARPEDVFSRVTAFLLEGRGQQRLHEDTAFATLPERPPGVEAERLRQAFLSYIGGQPMAAVAGG